MGTRRTRGGHGSGMGRIEPHFGSGPAPGAEGAAPKPAKKAAKAPSRRSERRQKPAKKARRGNGSRQSGKTRGFSLFRFVRGSVYWGAVASVWVGILCAGVLAYYALTLPSMDGLAVPKRPPSLQIVAVDGTPLAQRGKMRGHAVSLNELPPYLTQAVLATEDARFYGHFGVDPIGLARAMVVNVQAGRVVQGGSTITQQLAKNLFLEPDRTIERKLQEVILAFWLERRFTKDEILEMYLNRVYLGAGAYGVEAAAQRYYSKSARAVNLTEAATLAGLLKAPSRFAPTRNPERAAARAKVVLARMVDEGYITNREGEVALALPAEVARKRTTSIGYVADIVAEQASAFVGELTEDVIVETTIDAGLQTMAERALVAVMAAEGPGKGAEQAALVAVDGIGAVRALVGGVNYRSSQFNRAVTAKRQPGSAFKPFVYLAALETGLSPETVRIDGPTRINGWAPQNYDGDFLGPISLTHGLSRSVNTIAARLANETGYETVARTAKRMGIQSDLHTNPSLALGTAEVSLQELVAAYVPFSNGGFGTVTHLIKTIKTRDGEVLYQRTGTGPGRVVSPDALGAMNYMMSKTVTEGTAKRAAIADWPAAGKTGTSQDFRDAWFIGYTANLVAGIWVGNDDGTPTKKATGGSLPAQIWQDFMTEAHAGLPPLPLPGVYDPATDRPGPGPVDDSLPWLSDGGVREASAQPVQSQAPMPSAEVGQGYAAPEQNRGLFNVGFLRRLINGGG